MTEVVDHSEDFRRMRMRRQYARLYGIVERWKEEVEANPWPLLDQMNERMHRMERCIQEIAEAFDSSPAFIRDNEVPENRDIREEAFERLQKAVALIRAWREEDDAALAKCAKAEGAG